MVNYAYIPIIKIEGMELQINKVRTTHRLSVRAFAAVAGCSPHTVHQVDIGKGVPRFSTLRRLRAALGVEPRQIAEVRRALVLPEEDLR